MWGIDTPNINSKELIKAILTKEVDLDLLMPDDKQVPGFAPQQGQQAPPQWGMPAMPQEWAPAPQQDEIAALINNLQ